MKNHTPEIGKPLTILDRHFYEFQFKLYSMSNAINRTILIGLHIFFIQHHNVKFNQRFQIAKNWMSRRLFFT